MCDHNLNILDVKNILEPLNLNILINPWTLYLYCEKSNFLIYITTLMPEAMFKKKPDVNMLNDKNVVLGYISCSVTEDDYKISVNWIQSNVEKSGIGTYLMMVVAAIGSYYRESGIIDFRDSNIILDDMSDYPSLYTNIGCIRIDPPFPEMICDYNNILSYKNIFIDRYVNKSDSYFVDKKVVNAIRDRSKTLKGKGITKSKPK